ncbi:hypothetical protein C8R46DRAFT_1228246 [Mycena filopes]|nr:hypothetical protein C8R46DRAFT_1228246 [Mycena filopes]
MPASATSPPANSSRARLAKKRRSIMACTRCRHRKVRCITAEQPPKTPCERCVKRHLPCEYLAVVSDSDDASVSTSEAASPRADLPSSDTAGFDFPPSRTATTSPRPPRREHAPSLPYTAPPPPVEPTRPEGALLPQLPHPLRFSTFPNAFTQRLQLPYVPPREPQDAYSLHAARARQYLINRAAQLPPPPSGQLPYFDYMPPQPQAPVFDETYLFQYDWLADVSPPL